MSVPTPYDPFSKKVDAGYVCAAVEAVESRDAIVAWLDREITAHYAARIAKRRVRQQWARSRGAER